MNLGNLMVKWIFIIIVLPIICYSQSTLDSLQAELESELEDYKRNIKIDKSDKRVQNILETMYLEVLQSDLGEYSKETLTKYFDMCNNDTLTNGHILLLLDKYTRQIGKTIAIGKPDDLDIRYAVMLLLYKECKDLFDILPAITYIYMGELLMSNSQDSLAIDFFKHGLIYYPESIPMQMYLVYLDEANNIYYKVKLLKKNRNHWMVKRYIKSEELEAIKPLDKSK